MTDFKIDDNEEGHQTELPALELIEKLGYTYKKTYEINNERDDYREALLYDRLRKKIAEFNNFDEDETEQAIRQFEEDYFKSNLDIVDANEKTRIKMIGLSQEDAIDQPITVKKYGESTEDIDVKLFDFDNIDKNEFLVTNQYYLDGPKGHIEMDIVVFVNGIPLVIIECKKPSSPDYLSDAWNNNLSKYQDPQFGHHKIFFYNHAIIATCNGNARFGTVKSTPNYYAKWTSTYRISQDELQKLIGRVPTPQDIILAGMLERKTLLDMLKNFVVYETIDGKKVKKVAKHQQYRVVSKALDRLRTGKGTTDKGGVIWHTQGSGKSLSMVWFATQILYNFENPPIMIVTDRRQLDKQILGTFKNCGFDSPIRAKKIEHLRKLLQNPKGKTIMTTVQKFDDPDPPHTDEQVIVLVDEAHRTQDHDTATLMRNAMPNAIFFGFTGTPISSKEVKTYTTFGSPIDQYSFVESQKDGTTLPIIHIPRLPNVAVEGGDDIDDIFERVFKDLPKEEKAKLKRQCVTVDAIAQAPARIRMICKDIIEHFTKSIMPNDMKGMIVARSREAAVLYKRELDKLGGPTSKIIMSLEPGEKGKDDSLWDEYYLPYDEALKEAEKFTKSDNPIKLLIVVDMLLVGYDAPIVQAMYLDKPIKEHSLLQAIARVNRLYKESKTEGFIIDYVNVEKSLQDALAIFSNEDIQKAFDKRDLDLNNLENRRNEAMELLSGLDKDDVSGLLVRFESIQKRKELELVYKNFHKALESIVPEKEAAPYLEDMKYVAKARLTVRAKYMEGSVNVKEYGAKVQQMINDHIRALDITEFESKQITYENFLAHASKLKPDARNAVARSNIGRAIDRLYPTNPGYYGKLRERLERIIAEEKERQTDSAAYFAKYTQLYQDVQDGTTKRQEETGIKDPFELAIFDLLVTKPEDEDSKKKYASDIANRIKKETGVVDWKAKSSVEDEIYLATYDTLDKTKFDDKTRDKLATEIIKLARYIL